MEKKKTITLTLIGLFIFLFGIIGLTYAYWQLTLTQEDENLVYTDCLKLTTSLTNGGSFQLTDAYPMTNNELVSDFFPTQAPYHFTITNSCNAEVPISINMESLTTQDPNLKDAYVDVILWSDEDAESKFEPKTDEVLSHKGTRTELGNEVETPSYKLTENKKNESKIIAEAKEAYQLYKFKIGANATKGFNLLLFMDYDTPVSTSQDITNNAHWAGKITLNNYEAKPTLIETIQALPIQEEDSGASGIYEVKHTEDGITLEGTEAQKANLLKPEYRYAGKDPNNYVDFGEKYANDIYTFNDVEYGPYGEYDSIESCQENNVDYEGTCEIIHHQGEPLYWRIIGLVNTPEGQRIKLIKNDSIGNYSWDSSYIDVNYAYGVNEWSQSDLMKLLNPGYEENKDQICTPTEDGYDVTCSEGNLVNNSLYWDGGEGKCYNSIYNIATDCDFTNNSLPSNLKQMIKEITWNTGSNETEYNASNINVNEFYNLERSSNTGDICKEDNGGNGGNYCNDSVNRTTSWQGKVGLIYPSDYGYATSGGTETNRTSCFESALNSWNNFSYNECTNNDWLLSSSYYWTLSPIAFSAHSDLVFDVDSSGLVGLEGAYNARGVRPSVYLSSNVVVLSGDGSHESPYTLGLEE